MYGRSKGLIFEFNPEKKEALLGGDNGFHLNQLNYFYLPDLSENDA
jgi:hypothetical protein